MYTYEITNTIKHKVQHLSYIALSSPNSKDTEIAAITDSVVECIFSVLVTAGSHYNVYMLMLKMIAVSCILS